MTMRNHVIALLLILFFANTGFAQQAIVSREKPLNFSRKDCINLSIYDWPRTLLSYPVYFPEGIQSESELSLSDNKQSRSVPFQLSDKVIENGKLKSAVINFFAELPSGGEFNYTLYLRKNMPPGKVHLLHFWNRRQPGWSVTETSVWKYLPEESIRGTQFPLP